MLSTWAKKCAPRLMYFQGKFSFKDKPKCQITNKIKLKFGAKNFEKSGYRKKILRPILNIFYKWI